jgi:hypothetical protein
LFSGSVVWFSLEKTSERGLANHHGQPVLVFVVITGAAVLTLVLMSLPWLRNRERPPKAAGAPGPGAAGKPGRAGTLRPAHALRASAPAVARDGSEVALSADPPDLATSVAERPLPADIEDGPVRPPDDLLGGAFGPVPGMGASPALGAAGRQPTAAAPASHPAGEAVGGGTGEPVGGGTGEPVVRGTGEPVGEPAGHATGEPARQAWSVVGTVPPAIEPDPAHADRFAGNGLGGPPDHATWQGRSKAGSPPPATTGGDLAHPLPLRARADNLSYPAAPGGVVRMAGHGQHADQAEPGFPVIDPGDVQH